MPDRGRRLERLTCSWSFALAAVLLGAPAARAQPTGTSRADSANAAADDSLAAHPQRDIMDVLGRLFGRRVEPQPSIEARPGLSITLLPSVGYNPSYGAFIGVGLTFAGWLGDPATTSTSAGAAGGSYSTTGQISFHFKSDLFMPGNGMVLRGDWRYLDTSQKTYGLGGVEPGQAEYPMDFVMYRFYETLYLRVPESQFYVGLGYHYSRYQDIVDARADLGELTPFVVYQQGYTRQTTSSGISANVLFESRDNAVNARRGVYWNASLRSHNRGLGSDDDWQMFWSDLRMYPRAPWDRRDVLAIWNYLWLTFGDAPYLDLPAVGWDTYGRGGRGYLMGRTRGANQVYTEVEYRQTLTRDGLVGAVAFLGGMATSGRPGGPFEKLDPSGGVGLRVKFAKRTSTNLTVDVAWGEDQPMRWFFGMQEAF